MSIYDIKVKTIDGKEMSLNKYEGKVLLIVNTASRCGFTPQYKELETLYAKLGNEKFEVLGFPCNQFANQEPGGNQDIQSFCSLTYKTTFPLFEKIDVKGPHAHPLYRHLCQQKAGLFGNDVKWNFTKFLVDSKGNVVDRFAPTTSPLRLEQKIVELIK